MIVPPLTWSSDIASVLHAGFKPVFVDIDPRTLGMCNEKILSAISSKTVAIFLTHCQGFNALSSELLEEIQKKRFWLIEDVCESHGATFNQQKLGSFGKISNFSFYYAHHMSTIEGGMICTNSSELADLLKMYRSHGMTRELTNLELKEKYQRDFKDLNPDFVFAIAAFNVRNNEIGAILGINQLKRLDKNVEARSQNQDLFFQTCLPVFIAQITGLRVVAITHSMLFCRKIILH